MHEYFLFTVPLTTALALICPHLPRPALAPVTVTVSFTALVASTGTKTYVISPSTTFLVKSRVGLFTLSDLLKKSIRKNVAKKNSK